MILGGLSRYRYIGLTSKKPYLRDESLLFSKGFVGENVTNLWYNSCKYRETVEPF